MTQLNSSAQVGNKEHATYYETGTGEGPNIHGFVNPADIPTIKARDAKRHEQYHVASGTPPCGEFTEFRQDSQVVLVQQDQG